MNLYTNSNAIFVGIEFIEDVFDEHNNTIRKSTKKPIIFHTDYYLEPALYVRPVLHGDWYIRDKPIDVNENPLNMMVSITYK